MADAGAGRRRLWGLGAGAAALALDQASKWLAVGFLSRTAGGRIEVLPVLDFVLIWNRGASFGLLSEAGAGAAIAAVTCAVLVFCAIWLWRTDSLTKALALGLILGGGAGNLLDRIFYGGVADFISLKLFGFYYPYVFNLADLLLGAGAGLFFWSEWRRRTG